MYLTEADALADSDKSLFDAIEIGDGFNLNAPQRKLQGYSYFALYQLRDYLANRRTTSEDTKRPHVAYTPNLTDETETVGYRQRIQNVEALMRSTMSVEIARELGRRSIPYHLWALTHGMSGPEAAASDFLAQVYDEREDKTSMRTSIVPGWHSALLDPGTIAAQAKITGELSLSQSH